MGHVLLTSLSILKGVHGCPSALGDPRQPQRLYLNLRRTNSSGMCSWDVRQHKMAEKHRPEGHVSLVVLLCLFLSKGKSQTKRSGHGWSMPNLHASPWGCSKWRLGEAICPNSSVGKPQRGPNPCVVSGLPLHSPGNVAGHNRHVPHSTRREQEEERKT